MTNKNINEEVCKLECIKTLPARTTLCINMNYRVALCNNVFMQLRRSGQTFRVCAVNERK